MKTKALRVIAFVSLLLITQPSYAWYIKINEPCKLLAFDLNNDPVWFQGRMNHCASGPYWFCTPSACRAMIYQ